MQKNRRASQCCIVWNEIHVVVSDALSTRSSPHPRVTVLAVGFTVFSLTGAASETARVVTPTATPSFSRPRSGECRSAGWRSVSRPTLSIRKAPKTGDDFGFSAAVEAGNRDSATRALPQISGMPAVAGQNPAVAQTVLAPVRVKFFAGTTG